jgi:hypothetical protein
VFDSGRIVADGPKEKVLQAVQQQASKMQASKPSQGGG